MTTCIYGAESPNRLAHGVAVNTVQRIARAQ